MIPEEAITDIINGDFKTIYRWFDYLEPDSKTKRKVEEGINMKFPMEIITEEYYEEFPKAKKIRIHGFGRADLIRFKREVKAREKIMVTFIMENYNKEVTKSRVEVKS